MGRIIGIDLGTTYSAVAIPEERAGDGFYVLPECPGYSIIADRLKRRITPSVVAEDNKGQIVVGYSAKARAGLAPEPIMFAKRWMGEDKAFQLKKQGELQPVDVSAHVLRFLKSLAEEQLGEPVEEAVITIPAYFSLKARQMTEKAGEMAGLRVAQLAPEPVAAALMYCANDKRDPLRIMTYDLGGGTFDVAILEKRDGVISTDSILSFDGNRFLGGYDFDLLLARWMARKLCERGYDLELDEDNPADKVILAELLVYAERVKLKLSENESYELVENATKITDHAGNPVEINLTITRGEFEAMIRDLVRETLRICRRAIEKADDPKRAAQIDEIIMIGGSSRIPMIGFWLEKEFGRKPKLVMPDLCVALGAAIIAGTKGGGDRIGCLELDRIEKQTDLPHIVVTGRVVPDGELKSAEGCVVALRSDDGDYSSQTKTKPDGAFTFQGVKLRPNDQTDFNLTVTSAAGARVASHKFSVRQSSEAAAGAAVGGLIPTNMLSKPIYIDFADGPYLIAKERTPLPFEKVIPAETRDTSGQIILRVREENTPLGEIVMRDIPQTLPTGSAVDITVMIQENYQTRVRAYVPALARETTAVIELPVRAQKSREELQEDYKKLAARAEDALSSASPAAKFGKSNRLEESRETAERMFEDKADPAAIQDRLDEIENLVREISAGWRPEPPKAILDDKAVEAQGLIARLVKKKPETAQDRYDQQLEAILKEARKAYEEQNSTVWKDSFTRLVNLCDRVHAQLEEDTGGGGEINPAQLLLMCEKELSSLAEWAKKQERVNAAGKKETLFDRFKADFDELAESLRRIKPDAPNAGAQIVDWYRTGFKDLHNRLNAPDTIGLPGERKMK
jgi:actin-like ATPase involved in cell morphogenesis